MSQLLKRHSSPMGTSQWSDEDKAKWKKLREETWNINYQDKLRETPQKLFIVDFRHKELINIVEIIPVNFNKGKKQSK